MAQQPEHAKHQVFELSCHENMRRFQLEPPDADDDGARDAPRGCVLVLVCAIVVTIAVAKVFFALAHVSAGRDVADRRDPNMMDINAAWG